MMAFLLLPVAGLIYACWHVYVLLPLPAVWRWAVVAAGVVSFGLLFLNLGRVLDRMPMWLARVCYDVGCSSVFVLLYVVMVFLVLDLGRLVRLVPSAWMHDNGAVSWALALGLTAVFVAGNLNYRHKVRQPLTLCTDKPLHHPLRVVMMSDLHLGYHNPRKELARWVDMINRERPDMVLIAGDIIDGSIRPLVEEDMAAEMRRIDAPVYACLGNHEYYTGEPLAQQFYRDACINLLRDTCCVVGDVCLAGRDDRTNARRKSMERLSRDVDSTRFTILLDHQPYHLELAEEAGFDFQLSGHTHRGQVWPISWITDALYECSFGSHERGKTHYYVSSGMGIWGGKYRIGTRSEYIVAEIINKQQ